MLDKIIYFDKTSFKLELVPGDEAVIIYKSTKFSKAIVKPKFK